MLPIFRAFVGASLFASYALAQPMYQSASQIGDEINSRLTDVQHSARTNQLTAEKVLTAANLALNEAALITSSTKNDHLIHLDLKRLAADVPGARAIIVIGPDGELLYDSYTYPAKLMNLANRSYFKAAQSKPGIYVAEMVVGRSSGASFVPIVKRLGEFTYVTIASPYSLVDVQPHCADCWSLALQDDGDLISAFPPEAQVSPELLKTVADSPLKIGHSIMRYENSVVAVAWRKVPNYPFISVSVRGVPDTTAVEVDVN